MVRLFRHPVNAAVWPQGRSGAERGILVKATRASDFCERSGMFIPARCTVSGAPHAITPTTSGEAHEQVCDPVLMLVMYTAALAAVPVVTATTAAADSKEMKKHKKMKPTSARSEAPNSNPIPRDMSGDPDRKGGAIEPRREAWPPSPQRLGPAGGMSGQALSNLFVDRIERGSEIHSARILTEAG